METKNSILKIHIKHSKPIEINNLTSALESIGNLYVSYVTKHGGCDAQAKASLYVDKVEEGSLVFYLTELVSATLIPFVENVNTIVDFASFAKNVIDYFSKGIGQKPNLTLSECNDFNNVYSVVEGDNNGEVSIGAVSNGNHNNIFVNCTFNFNESNRGRNQLEKETEQLKIVIPGVNSYSKQLMTIFQMRGDMNSDIGNRATIENISSRKIPVLFADENLKIQILNSDMNPVKRGFIVDVECQYANNKIAAYKILKLHETIPIDE